MIKSKLQSQFPPSFIQTFTEQAWTLCFVPEDIFKIDFTNFQGPKYKQKMSIMHPKISIFK